MDTRRLPLLLLLVLLPVPAQADAHNMECFAGLSPGSLAVRLSFGVLLEGTVYGPDSAPQGVADGRNETSRLSAATDTGAEPAEGDGKKPRKRKGSLFLVAEADKYVVGRDSGHALDGWMIGVRQFFRGQSRVQPFVHGMGGRQRPSRENDVTAGDDAATAWAGAAAVGGGVDINPSKTAGIVPVIRLQLDLVESGATPGFDTDGRFTFGVSFRFEGSHK